MIIATREELLKTVALELQAQYGGDWEKYPNQQRIYRQLIEAEALTEEEIDFIIGNDGWTDFTCCECQSDDAERMVILQAPGDEAKYLLCDNCVHFINAELMGEPVALDGLLD